MQVRRGGDGGGGEKRSRKKKQFSPPTNPKAFDGCRALIYLHNPDTNAWSTCRFNWLGKSSCTHNGD